MPLVLTRNSGESIYIGNDILVTTYLSTNNRIKVVIDAPEGTLILRSELIETVGSESFQDTRKIMKG
jgi:carbon storage regulator CsrA